MQPTPLITQLANRIVEHMRSEGLGEGERLTERRLAELFRVSRSPIRGALRLLEEAGIVRPTERGGFVIAKPEGMLPATLEASSTDDDEQVYFQIADDRLNGRLPERITENELLRRYSLTRGRLTRILRRIANEGWIERLPGHGWAFLPVLTSLQAYEDSYRFRLLIEPAAILEPRFTLNRPALERCREQQQWLIDGGIWEVSDAKLFELNSGMHETIIECSQNGFFIDALKRIDRVRRLIDYRQMLDRESAIGRCREHVHLLDLLLADKRIEASDFMRQHLTELSTLKTAVRTKRQEKAPQDIQNKRAAAE
ncbi:GntR family transcriptional regulator [Microvirga vignae]|uniref:GntR family transcriptional regulator n=1 Tax=Microvirga vignae TaxID=1225564 RepID=A0A0H1R6K7_9HYPH|nr:GntR family transcriptional regulator [Microvirga vignae]KLK90865.1 GntR family transcriptional regulator [Microvirga vignae]